MTSVKKLIGALKPLSAVLAATLICQTAHAVNPSDYIYTPIVEQGEREIDFKLGTTKPRAESRESESSLGFGYGATSYWFTEFYVKYKRENTDGRGQATFFDAFEWENKFQLTPQGQYFVDLGFITEIERPDDRREGYEVRFGPLIQKEFGQTQLNFNLLFERNYRAEESNPLRLLYQWQAKYRLSKEFEFGAQALGEFGNINHFLPKSEQTHVLGPAIFGKIPLGGRNAITYNAAFLVNIADSVHSRTFRTQIEYEF